MNCLPFHGIKQRQSGQCERSGQWGQSEHSGKKIAVLALLICFVVVSLLPGVFILTHADHEHENTGGSCAVCIRLLNAENMLKQLSTVSFVAAVVILGLYADTVIANVTVRLLSVLTPVTLKIRMNN